MYAPSAGNEVLYAQDLSTTTFTLAEVEQLEFKFYQTPECMSNFR